MMELLIKNARIIDSSQDFKGDVYIKFGVIEELGLNLNKDCEAIDAEGLVLMPSFIDLHSHFRDPGLTYKEDIYTGSLAAVRGGYTAVNLMANTVPICSDMETVNYVLNKCETVNLIDIHQSVSITKDLRGEDISHLDKLDSSVKMISDDGRGVSNSKVMLEAMFKAKEKNLMVISHAESEELSSFDTRLAENTMTWRDIALSKFTGCHLHVAHVSTKEAMKDIIRAKKEGVSVTCEVAPHHLTLTSKVQYKVNPPLRETEDINYLVNAIKEGWVDAIATDHAPHSSEDKLKGANGISGLETAFSLCYTKLVDEGHISINKLSELMSKKPANLMKLKKGEIKIGYDGDLVLIDLDKEYKIDAENFRSKGRNSPFDGLSTKGMIVNTIKAGRVVYSL
ncbi:dihydroorotase [Clostridium sp. YIM B02515]|uniref:Dihydroorotase n=1 Tax=Clostridium rhizosphaerae TaxID=2803861 RepID=A0ABS1T6D8_9CLOT|nr:dihydroorotase [Clostridium rhizosphaerae]MBL4934692.1 dihydroorotase [Clostridium rhizosphaerae]